ncbi:helix-turn-helix domain-containing protein [Streptomyces sp. NPDC006733]|uniref:helix-turn-helix domain-containing protein n=1 Tax=Streptomyces sp. NPDC006733 TaxID=3155460 RepID=UPI0033FF0073
MGRWKPLPPSVPPELARLVVQLRILKDRSELSLTALAAKTACSKSAWNRYLNGHTLPPRQVVAALGHLTGADPDRLMAWWERADTAWNHHDALPAPLSPPAAATPAPAAQPSAPTPALDEPRAVQPVRPRYTPTRWATTAGVTAVAVVAALVGTWLLGSHDNPQGAPAHRSASTPNSSAPGSGPCRADTCRGRLPAPAFCERDATTAASLQIGSVHIELRHSALCQSAWGRLLNAGPYDRITVTNDLGDSATAKVRSDSTTVTTMVGVPPGHHAVVCTRLNSQHGEQGCTPPMTKQ